MSPFGGDDRRNAMFDSVDAETRIHDIRAERNANRLRRFAFGRPGLLEKLATLALLLALAAGVAWVFVR